MNTWIPAVGIKRHAESLRGLTDDDLLLVLQSVEPLPDGQEIDGGWVEDEPYDRLELLIALADQIGERRLLAGIAPLYERASLGDGAEFMQSIRHGPEQAVAPDFGRLTEILRPLAAHERPGCRLWVVRELGVLRDPSALGEMLGALDDDAELVRDEACMSLGMIWSSLDNVRRAAVENRLARAAETDSSSAVRAAAARALSRLSDQK
jgi:hypothetical protein